MKYTAPDGHIIESSPLNPVTYSCNVVGVEGTFESYETTAANDSIGIQQIKIVRVITAQGTSITITESTADELIAYKESLNPVITQ